MVNQSFFDKDYTTYLDLVEKTKKALDRVVAVAKSQQVTVTDSSKDLLNVKVQATELYTPLVLCHQLFTNINI